LKGYTTTWNWSNLKELNYLNLIGKNFLMYAGAIVAIALTFFLASLIIKKEINFIKSLSIAATSVIPAVVGAMILSPILSLMYAPLGIIISVVGLVYSIIILYELVNTELKLEGEQKVYFNLICFGILGCMGYYAYVNLIAESVSSELSGLLDLFN
jgi:hypothetical protein